MKISKRLPELQLLIVCTIGCYIFLEIFVASAALDGFFGFSGVDIIFISFLLSFFVAIISVIAGVGGGVIITPLMLAFTSIDTLITGPQVSLWRCLVVGCIGPFYAKGPCRY